jgi:plastocyanin
MSIRFAPFARRRTAALLALLLLAGISLALIGRGAVRRAQAAPHETMAGMNMSDAAMQRQSAAWFALHPAHPASIDGSTAVVADSFMVNNFYFDENHDAATTQIDTAKITKGQSITWVWQAGVHTITSGTGAADLNMGVMFNAPSNSSSTRFTVTFDTTGTFPFFCQFHEVLNMKGVVVVTSVAGVEPLPAVAGRVGFLASPFPNPSGGGTSFRFALARAGRASAAVYDVRGRLVARLLDADLAAGAYSAKWDGRGPGGIRAAVGAYWIQLSVPGSTTSRRFVVVR